MRAIFLVIILSSCSQDKQEASGLPNYSDMGAAADAGMVQP